jgi:hypothetical protein
MAVWADGLREGAVRLELVPAEAALYLDLIQFTFTSFSPRTPSDIASNSLQMNKRYRTIKKDA